MEEYESLDRFFNSPSPDNDLKQRMSDLCYNEDQNSNSYTTSVIGSNFEAQDGSSSGFLSSCLDYNMDFNPFCDDQKLGCHHNTAVPMNGIVPSSSLLVSCPEMGNSRFTPLDPSFQNVPRNIPHPSHAPSFDGLSSSSHHSLGLNGIGGFGFEQGQYIDASSNFLEAPRNYPLPSFGSGREDTMTPKSNGSQSLSRTSASTRAGECKPRARARRGQATDPHSIAERIRREKIADRMKNLQELLPNLNKTDKASTLDEIIEYVKFLQLQVKVLSTSRVGAAVTESQPEEKLYRSDEVAFERELVKLMESNVSKAMQLLQTKGLSLMPLALASSPPTDLNNHG